MPHCDDRVLHAPGECIYCDKYPRLQKAREGAGINFTGHRAPDKEMCPSEKARPLETIYRWHGNIPMTKELEKQEKEEWARFWKELDDNDLWAKPL